MEHQGSLLCHSRIAMLCDTTELLRHNSAAVIQVQKKEGKKRKKEKEKKEEREKKERGKKKRKRKMRIESYGLCCTGT